MHRPSLGASGDASETRCGHARVDHLRLSRGGKRRKWIESMRQLCLISLDPESRTRGRLSVRDLRADAATAPKSHLPREAIHLVVHIDRVGRTRTIADVVSVSGHDHASDRFRLEPVWTIT